MNDIYNFKDINNKDTPLLSNHFIQIVNNNKIFFNKIIKYDNDILLITLVLKLLRELI